MYNLLLIGEKIRSKRKELGLTQIEFANNLDISQGSLSEIESGKTKPSFDVLTILADKYYVDLNWLLINRYNDLTSALQENESTLLDNYRNLEIVAQDDLLDYSKMKLIRYHRKFINDV